MHLPKFSTSTRVRMSSPFSRWYKEVGKLFKPGAGEGNTIGQKTKKWASNKKYSDFSGMAKGPGAKTEYFLEEVHHMVSRYFLPKKCLELHFFKKGRHRCERGRSGGSGGDGGRGGDQVWGASEGGQDKQVCGLQEGTILLVPVNMYVMVAKKTHASCVSSTASVQP